jgi:sodium transport system permease protein
MNNILTIMKKELFRFFHDKRMIMATLIMPGLMIYIMYSFIGQAAISASKGKEGYQTTMYVMNMPASLKPVFDSMNVSYQDTNGTSMDDMKQNVSDKKDDMIIVFPENFDQKVAAFDSTTSKEAAPQIAIYYNSSRTESSKAYASVTAVLNQYESSMINKFDVNASANTQYDLASDKDLTAQLFSTLFPMLLMTFIFSACMSIAPESIAGEKERGTLTTILVTPIRRSQLAIGKILSLSVLAVLSGISSFIGTALALPKMVSSESLKDSINTNVYGMQDYLLLFVIVLCSVLVIISVISIISAYAKTVKEAASFISPLMIVVIIVSLSTMFSDGVPSQIYWYFIPLYNSVQCMCSVFMFKVTTLNVLVTVVSNVVYSGVFVFLLTKMFNSERVMLSK